MQEKPFQIIRAKELRKNMPNAEKKLWYAINDEKLGVKFRRQQPIGPYYVDFICFEQKLIIELDGDQHADNAAAQYDNRRTDFIESQGYKLIRIPNGYICKNLDSVIEHLKMIVNGNISTHEYFKSKYDFEMPKFSPPPKSS
ncbi:MAG: DUF559 domain-containing protein [Proteobacteria bacterium]|nr:DUF559 domain-containing protein [Pseudomonadota bacterium]